ncbi:peptide chain release factor N(5)-glutamine methyltransferase [Exilibacterium tricleocarpae]|uniref:Release factor glutamine methyltransferase n=1 Tax=Exilibacterium tricleocarpae TaxID=2591008 RepID=A0A545U5P7_9GAMM|nr:peptide chain release factor N(5)-glutamine methyltransferase [Exilibacterium tricleocarpae]TQV84791.1 peptide chain release factor N(5)-glutamine methyltransferase [Exilibacterium tricleocarpae]
MATIGDCLQRAAELAAVSESPRLDVEVLLARVLERDRAYLYTWPERELDGTQRALFAAYIEQRLAGTPIAYILGEKEFWSLSLQVNDATLIPRPETECLVERALQLLPPTPCRVIDLGTGSGAIALALAGERPQWQVFAVDASTAAVALAEQNRCRLGLDNVTVQRGNWLAAFDAVARLDMVVSNPPYIDAADPHLQRGDVRFEPRSALVAAAGGLAAIDTIAQQACGRLEPGGWLLVEHGYRQGAAVRALLRRCGFVQTATHTDMAGCERMTEGRLPTILSGPGADG